MQLKFLKTVNNIAYSYGPKVMTENRLQRFTSQNEICVKPMQWVLVLSGAQPVLHEHVQPLTKSKHSLSTPHGNEAQSSISKTTSTEVERILYIIEKHQISTSGLLLTMYTTHSLLLTTPLPLCIREATFLIFHYIYRSFIQALLTLPWLSPNSTPGPT